MALIAQTIFQMPFDEIKILYFDSNVTEFGPRGPIDNKPMLIPMMAWRRKGDKSLINQRWQSSLTHICDTRWDQKTTKKCVHCVLNCSEVLYSIYSCMCSRDHICCSHFCAQSKIHYFVEMQDLTCNKLVPLRCFHFVLWPNWLTDTSPTRIDFGSWINNHIYVKLYDATTRVLPTFNGS